MHEREKWYVQVAPKSGDIECCEVTLGGTKLTANSDRFVETLFTTENFLTDMIDKNDSRLVEVTENGEPIFSKPVNKLSILSHDSKIAGA